MRASVRRSSGDGEHRAAAMVVDGLGGSVSRFSFFYFSCSINGGRQSNRLRSSRLTVTLSQRRLPLPASENRKQPPPKRIL
ncbi:hypothetical protein C2845_PM05G10710 [Panicum miliaceum]|uniref:Uncharacterized protein n=1 Tax=Panicum miliaceum TaxID=4540 RepID=A0A3L6SX44_PANMI|nr:hypothetical protein C2845_PM05G10710 [Panicum miliaceum]